MKHTFELVIDVLINNAGKEDSHSMDTIEPEHWHRALALNLDHQFFATQVVAKAMTSKGAGSIIMLGSISWMRRRPA
ncbi:SDR family NAD(P)-dependent oxidoreductase [Rhizobium sp.]|uniref:SDR family NAD(P)-dependent oxidoreductase n=1 Tax=Rhizobium sp. TaxID=391 RepID=UPI002AA6E36E